MSTYKTYSVAELRAWLIDNEQNGISEWSIDPCRAFAFINNPCAKDDDPALVVVFDDTGTPIGFTGAIAEDFAEGNLKGRYYWGSTEWLNPAYRGKGIAAEMMKKIKEDVGFDKYLALESSEASVRLDKKQGSDIQYYPRIRYGLSSKSSFAARCYSYYLIVHNRRSLARLRKYSYQNNYVVFIDENTYGFIKAHSGQDLFLRKKEMLNWMLHYPFLLPVGEDKHAMKNQCEFGSMVSYHAWTAVKVMIEGTLRGFYIVSQTDKVRTLRYLYYDKESEDAVFASVANDLIRDGVEEIRFFPVAFHEFLLRHSIKRINRKNMKEPIAFTFPQGLDFDPSKLVQGGDGDMFC